MALTPNDVGQLRHSLKSLLEIWMRMKLVIQKAFGKGAIVREHENAFLKLKSDLSRLYRIVGDRLPKELQFEGDDMIELMKNATSMELLHGLPLTEKRNIFSQWHRIYVLMSRTFGALEVMDEGYYPRLHRSLIAGRKGKKKGKGKK